MLINKIQKKSKNSKGTFRNYVTQKFEFLVPIAHFVVTFEWFSTLKNHTV